MLAVADSETPAETAAIARDMARTENRGVVTIDTLRYLVVFVRAPVLPEGGATLVQVAVYVACLFGTLAFLTQINVCRTTYVRRQVQK